MKTFFLLDNQVRHYDWGSSEWIPSLLNIANSNGSPWAELWMGAHPGAPSSIVSDQGPLGLDLAISEHPDTYLGSRTLAHYATLPFLFKLLAAERPLSIQAHPNLEQARLGYAREEAEGLAIGVSNRNYKDPNHKPEIVCAITPFRAMCGFREGKEAARMLAAVGLAEGHSRELRHLASVTSALESNEGGAYKTFLEALFSLSDEGRTEMTSLLRLAADKATGEAAWDTVRSLIETYPDDPGLLSPLYLNVIDLKPREALFLPAGVLHAYVKGFAVELMASSDNVLRGGLTQKHVDVPELLKTLRFEPWHPDKLQPVSEGPGLGSYPTEGVEFKLSSLSVVEGQPIKVPCGEPGILVVIEGSISLSSPREEHLDLKRGQSAFISGIAENVTAQGKGAAYLARAQS